MSFLKHLRERRLVQITFSYVAAGWVVLSVIDQFTDRGIMPAVFYQIALIWYLLGIPAALLIGWYHGEKGKQRAPIDELAVLVILLLAATGFSGRTVTKHLAARKLAESAENPLQMRSVAVKYFEDRTASQAYQYLADGLTEDLIAELQMVDALTVRSRNATAPFRETDVSADSIAVALQVGTVVQGYIETRGERLRVNLQVIDGQSGTMIERATIDKPLDQVSALREEVAGETARLLRQWIGKEVRLRESAQRTASTAAWLQLQRSEKVRKDAEERIRDGDVRTALGLFDSADEMLAMAEAADPSWPDPIVQRGFIAYRRARLAQGTPEEASQHINEALAHAARALDLDRTSGRALELRGTTNYYAFLLQIAEDPAEQAKLLESAQSDLELAVKYEPGLASAHATLSHLYLRSDISDAVLAASRAYEQDAYLESADVVLWRLFTGSLELENFTKARQWCTEGSRRFPEDYRFVTCHLRMMSTPGGEASADSAWRLLARQDSLTPEARFAFEHTRGLLTVGGVLARANLADSAKRVLNRTSAAVTPELDPTHELVATEAYMRVLTGEKDRAVDLLSRFAAANPEVLEGSTGEVQWWWRGLQDNPRFRRMMRLE